MQYNIMLMQGILCFCLVLWKLNWIRIQLTINIIKPVMKTHGEFTTITIKNHFWSKKSNKAILTRNYLFVLLPVHCRPCKLGRLQTVVEVAFAFWVCKQEDLNEINMIRIKIMFTYKALHNKTNMLTWESDRTNLMPFPGYILAPLKRHNSVL